MSLSNKVKDLLLSALGSPEARDELVNAINSGGGGGVSDVTADDPLSSSGGSTPDITLTGIVPIENGGTGSDTQNFVDLSDDQSIDGNKTFTGTILAANLSGTNTGNLTIQNVGGSGGSNSNGMVLSGQLLQLSPATNIFPGVVTASAQTFGGLKTFPNFIALATTNAATVGAIRLANQQFIEWRNAANSSNVSMNVDANDTFSLNGAVMVNGNTFIISQPRTPTSASDDGIQGQIAWDDSFIYVCVDIDTWKRVAISTW